MNSTLNAQGDHNISISYTILNTHICFIYKSLMFLPITIKYITQNNSRGSCLIIFRVVLITNRILALMQFTTVAVSVLSYLFKNKIILKFLFLNNSLSLYCDTEISLNNLSGSTSVIQALEKVHPRLTVQSNVTTILCMELQVPRLENPRAKLLALLLHIQEVPGSNLRLSWLKCVLSSLVSHT